MTAPTHQVPNPAPGRPLTVTFSSILLFVVAGVQLLSAAMVTSLMGTVTDAYADTAAGEDLGTDLESVMSFAMVAVAGIYAVIAIVLAVLAVFNNMGKNGSRVTTWVFAGLGLCCNSIGLGGSAIGTLAGGGSPGVSQDQLDSELNAVLPGWYESVSTAVAVVIVLALLGAVILLALPQSNAYFRRPVAWNPAMPYPQYPGQPGFPVQQGYPAPPGYPAQPGYHQPSYPPAQQPQYPPPYNQPGAPSHFGSPEQYGQPGQPAPGLPPYPGQAAPGLPPYPGQAGTHAPGSPGGSSGSAEPEPTSDPWATPDSDQAQSPPTTPFSSSPPSPPSSEPTSDPWAPPAPWPASSSPEPSSDPWAKPPADDDQNGDPPQRPSSSPS